MNVLTSNGTKWILFKRFNEFIDIDKEVCINFLPAILLTFN